MIEPAPAVDLLRDALEQGRPLVADTERTLQERLRMFWSVAKAARDLAARDVWGDELVRLAVETGLFAAMHKRSYRTSAIDLNHVLQWAWRGRNPWR